MGKAAGQTKARLGCDISPNTRHKLIACLEIAPDGAYITNLEGAVLLDIKMPNMSGIELYQYIKEIYLALVQRIMFITGDVLEKSTNDFLTKNGVPNIIKPIDIDKLSENINRILSGEPA